MAENGQLQGKSLVEHARAQVAPLAESLVAESSAVTVPGAEIEADLTD